VGGIDSASERSREALHQKVRSTRPLTAADRAALALAVAAYDEITVTQSK
jgi:hypothetical protein